MTTSEKKEYIGALIKSARKKCKITQMKLAEQTGLSRSFIGDVELGRYMPSVESLIKIAVILDLDLNLLLTTEIQGDDYFE